LTDLSVIVVSYGMREMTLRCLDSVVRETRVSYELLVVDNASPDGSAQAVAACFPNARVMALTENQGFAAACNIAADEAKGRYLLLLNPDALVTDRAIDRLLARARETPWAGIWGGRTVFENGRLNPQSCWRRPTLWNQFCAGFALNTRFPRSPLFNSLGYGGWRRDSEREVDILEGCFLLINRDVWNRLGGFAHDFFMYGEDSDLCLRARRLGARPRFVPQAVVIHEGSGSEPDRVRKMRQMLAARTLLARRHISPLARPLALAFIAARPMIGRFLARRDLRPLWNDVWAGRRDWLAGRY
jgi:GT2 family glycosyltransferase